MTLDEIVSDYIREYRHDARAEMQTFRREKSRAAAIHRAALCEFPDGKRHPHQYLIPQRLLTLAEERLQAAITLGEALRRARPEQFADLMIEQESAADRSSVRPKSVSRTVLKSDENPLAETGL
jgi:hypothetical protein